MPTTLHASVCYHDRGKKKPWIARIVGTDSKFGVNREFLAVRNGEARVTEDGLYEMTRDGLRSKDPTRTIFVLVRDGTSTTMSEEAALAIAAHLEAGGSVTDLAPRPNATDGGTEYLTARGDVRVRSNRVALGQRAAELRAELAAIEAELTAEGVGTISQTKEPTT